MSHVTVHPLSKYLTPSSPPYTLTLPMGVGQWDNLTQCLDQCRPIRLGDDSAPYIIIAIHWSEVMGNDVVMLLAPAV